MSNTTIREQIDAKIGLLRDMDSLTPEQIAQELVELSSLWASLSKLMVDREITYAHVMVALIEKHETVAKAKIYGMTTSEYKDLAEAKAYWKSTQDLIRSCKKFINLQTEQLRESKY